jgi:D-alanyl-D-alanine dipeptidase
MLSNIRKRFNITDRAIFVFLLLLSTAAGAQDSAFTRPPVTDKLQQYYKQVKDDPGKQMVELKSRIPGLVYDLRYASTNNFMHRMMYPKNTRTAWLRSSAAANLQKVQAELATQGMGLKIFDAYRPYSVTVKFWELVKDDRYVANPAKGSGHNRGIAVDLTIIDTKTKKELDMGTGFDNFTDSAHHAFTALPEAVLKNRQLLKSTMEKYGFNALDTEWWHYSLPEGNRFELLDIYFR